MRVRVDVGSLAELAGAIGVLEDRLRAGTAALRAALAVEPLQSPAAASLLLAERARRSSLDELAALRAAVTLAGEGYTATEARVSALMASCPQGALGRLVSVADPASLERLLVGAPMLARAMLAEHAAGAEQGVPDRLADELTRTLLLPFASAAAAQARLFAGMDPRERLRFALVHPTLVAALPAAPPPDRIAASRVLIAAALGAALHDRARLAPGLALQRVERRIALAQRLLDEQVVLRHPDGTTTRHPHQVLNFDAAGDGRILEVIGDLSRARHLAVYVPGTGSDLDRYAGSFESLTPFAAADRGLAVVLWQNADHPDQPFDDPLSAPAPSVLLDPAGVVGAVQQYAREHVLAAAYRDSADAAGPALAADVAGLRVALPRAGADLTVLGHSYGGSIVGSAEAHGMVADRVVHVASAGAYVGDVREYASAATQRFSMTAYDDPIRLAQGHGALDAAARLRTMLPTPLDPIAPAAASLATLAVGGSDQIGHGLDPDLIPGVVRLDTGVHDDGRLVRGHSSMFEPDSTAWRNLLAVMTKGKVSVLQPELWSSHLDTVGAALTLPGGAAMGGTTMRLLPPRYVVDRSPYDDPAYRAPLLDLH